MNDLYGFIPWKQTLAELDGDKRVSVLVRESFVVDGVSPDNPGIRGRVANVGETVRVPRYLVADLRARGLAEPA